jgi:hypothetical protein
MKVIIRRGKYKGQEHEVSQWCNDWFTLDSNRVEIATKPFSPSSLAFQFSGIQEIREHKNNGMLFSWYEPTMIIGLYAKDGGIYSWSFKKRKLH